MSRANDYGMLSDAARGVLAEAKRLFVDGAWREPIGGKYFDNLTPITGGKICEIPRSDEKDINAALDAAHAAKDKWGRTSAAERSNILMKIAQRMEDKLEVLAQAESWDNGKPIRETMAADIPLAIDHFRYFASCIRAQEGSIGEIDHDTVAYHFHEPLGVVGVHPPAIHATLQCQVRIITRRRRDAKRVSRTLGAFSVVVDGHAQLCLEMVVPATV